VCNGVAGTFSGVHPSDWTCDNETIAKDDICSCNGTLQSTTSSIVSEVSVCAYNYAFGFQAFFEYLNTKCKNDNISMFSILFCSIYSGISCVTKHGFLISLLQYKCLDLFLEVVFLDNLLIGMKIN